MTTTQSRRKCGECQCPGHNARTCTNVSSRDVHDAFVIGGYTMNERVSEGGFVYFPEGRPFTAENEDQGRMFWKVVDGVRGTTRPVTYDDLHINGSWGRASQGQIDQMYTLLEKYVNYNRQQNAVQNVED